MIDHSHTLNTVHVIGSQNHPEVSWFLIGPRRSHGAAMSTQRQTLECANSNTWLLMVGRPGCLLPGLAITNKNFQKDDVYSYAPPWLNGISHSAAIRRIVR